MNRQTNFGQAVFAILRKIKREATPHTSKRRVPSHFILSQHTQSPPTTLTYNFGLQKQNYRGAITTYDNL